MVREQDSSSLSPCSTSERKVPGSKAEKSQCTKRLASFKNRRSRSVGPWLGAAVGVPGLTVPATSPCGSAPWCKTLSELGTPSLPPPATAARSPSDSPSTDSRESSSSNGTEPWGCDWDRYPAPSLPFQLLAWWGSSSTMAKSTSQTFTTVEKSVSL